MTMTVLPFRATTAQACDWLAGQTGEAWQLARLLEHALTPYVWLDFDGALPALFGDANGGYAAPIFFQDDIAKLAAGADTVLITMTKDAYKIVATLPPPGLVRQLDELRFLKKDVERLAARLKRESEPQVVKVVAARESQAGIGRAQVLHAFGAMVRVDLEQALDAGGGIFGDEGARVKGSAKQSKNKAIWNPVTLALGLSDVHRVPLAPLKRAFATHDFLAPWLGEWEQSLALLGK